MSERFIANVSRGRVMLLVLGAMLMGAVSGFVALNADFETRPIAQAAGWAGLFFFPLCAIVAIRQLFRTGAVIEIGSDGLLWRRWGDTRIPWSAFTHAQAVQIQRQKALSLWLADPDAYRSTTLLGRLAGANKAIGFGDITLTVQGTDRRFDDMAEAVDRHAPQLFRS